MIKYLLNYKFKYYCYKFSFFIYYKLNFEFIYLKKYYKDKFKNYIYIFQEMKVIIKTLKNE